MADRKIEYGRWPGRKDLQPGQISRVRVVDAESGEMRTVIELPTLFEAPNWTADGKWLIINGGGRLYRVAADGSGGLTEIPTGAIDTCNNDHVLSPDNSAIYFSAAGRLYRIPFAGGEPEQISNEYQAERGYTYWLHGISPDARTLVYTAVERVGEVVRGKLSIATIPAGGGADIYLVSRPEKSDGPEYTPDGQWIYFNSEIAAERPGHAQIFRMRPDGTGIERVTYDDRVNWFPHFSPNGRWMAYISYEPGTLTHPADLDIQLRVMPANGGESRVVVSAFGGQGTFNVNSWAPDCRHFAYVDYPFAD
jgi:Tol biopolymer transport system component